MAQRPLSLPLEVAFKLRQLQNRALPGLLLIGGEKCASTSIYNYLIQHPNVAGVVRRVDPRKPGWVSREVNYFSQEINFVKGESWYRAHFQRPREGVLNFESTPSYLTSPLVPGRAHALIPQAKLIVSLRDPVDRSFSAYHHMRRDALRRSGASVETFREYVDRRLDTGRARDTKPTDWDILGKGRYAEGLERWFALYPREQFCIIDFRNFIQNTSETIAEIITFLGLPPAPIDTGQNLNPGSYSERMDPDTEQRLREYFEPHNRRLEALLGYSMGW